MFIKAIAQGCRQSGIAIGGAAPYNVVEITAHGERQILGQGHGIHGRQALCEPCSTRCVLTPKSENRCTKVDIQTGVKVPIVPPQPSVWVPTERQHLPVCVDGGQMQRVGSRSLRGLQIPVSQWFGMGSGRVRLKIGASIGRFGLHSVCSFDR